MERRIYPEFAVGSAANSAELFGGDGVETVDCVCGLSV
jgi:hypothetical protein